MAKTSRTRVYTTYARRKTRFGPRLKKISQTKEVEKSTSPRGVSDNQLIASENDPQARERMFAEKQRQATKRSAYRNLTTQITSTGANVASGYAATQGLNQNIAGGASHAEKHREDDSDSDEEADNLPPAY